MKKLVNEDTVDKKGAGEKRFLPGDHHLSFGEKLVAHLVIAAIASSGWIYSGGMFSFIAFPLCIVSLLGLIIALPAFRTATYKYSAAFFFYMFAAPFFLGGMSFVLAALFSHTDQYNICFDIQTPDGVVTVVNKIVLEDNRNPISRLRSFYSGSLSIKGKASVVMLGEDKALVATIAPPDRYVFGFLKTLDYWIESPYRKVEKENGVIGYSLTPVTVPAMACIREYDEENRYSFVTKDTFEKEFGAGYSFIRAWVTFDDVEGPHVLTENVTWWDYEKHAPKKGRLRWSSLGIDHKSVYMDETSKALWWRI